MIVEIDVWRAAQQLVRRYGETAWFEAVRRADAMLDKGDVDGAAVWRRIVKAVEALQDRAPPGEGTAVH